MEETKNEDYYSDGKEDERRWSGISDAKEDKEEQRRCTCTTYFKLNLMINPYSNYVGFRILVTLLLFLQSILLHAA